MGHGPGRQGAADGVVDQGGDLDRHPDHGVVGGHVLEDPLQVDLLLESRPEELGGLHAGDGQHGDVVELGVVEAVQQVEPARPGRGQADPEAPGRLGVAARHEGGRLLVVHEDEADPVLVAAQPLHDSVDAVTGKAEDHVDAPVDEAFDQQLRGDLGHGA